MPRLSYAVVLIAMLATSPAGAEDLRDPDFSASGSIGVSHLVVPQNQFILDRQDVNPFRTLGTLDTDRGRGFAPHLRGEVGYRLTPGGGGMPAFGIAVTGDYQYLSLSENSEYRDTGPAQSIGFASFGGFGLRTIDFNSIGVRSERMFRYGTGELLGTATVPLGKNGSVSLFAGPSMRYLRENTRLHAEIRGTLNVMDLSEQIDTLYLGGTIGASVQGSISDRWSLALRGAVSLYEAMAEYDGFYDDNQANDQALQTNGHSRAHAFALDVSLNRHIGKNVTIGVTMGVDYLSDSPQIRYPGPATAPDNPVLRIGFEQLLSMKAGASLVIRF